jgi:hypothetical protein
MAPPLLSELPLWEQHEERVVSIMRSALARFHTRRPPMAGEPELNREFFLCILEVNRENRLAGDAWFDYPPSYEARNPPSPGTEGSASERKVPDFHWGYLDHEEPDARRSVRTFVIECKRLGAPSSAGWAFNVHYVDDGVGRFRDPDWRYGKDVGSGAMVGYVESMTPDEILAEVNGASATRGLPQLSPTTQAEPLHEFDHAFDRPFEVSPFRLLHLWVESP